MSDNHDRPTFAADEAVGVRPEAAPAVEETPTLHVAEELAPAAEHPPVEANGTHGEPTWRTSRPTSIRV